MAYIPGFEHDIFISYSHVDNLAPPGDPLWVEQFHKQLQISLDKRIGRMGLVKIWRDKKLEGDHLFDQTIKQGVDKSALFVAMTSNGYLASEYCQQELKWFRQKAGAEPYGLQIGDRSRIYNALLTNIPHDEWPSEYGRISGHPFHDAEQEEDFGEPTDQTEKNFHKQLRALADSLYKMLRAFKEAVTQSQPKPPPEETPAAEDAPTVFFADVTDSLRSPRTRVINELQRKGIKVVTGIPPPYEAQAHNEKVQSSVKNAALTVHLLDQFAGREMDGEPGKSYPHKQVNLAKDQAVTQLIWVPKSVDLNSVEEENHKNFLDQLENGDREKAGYDFVRGALASLAPQILEKLEQLQTPSETGGGTKAVLLDTHLKDQMHALEISHFLLKNKIQPYINPQEDDPNKNMDVLETRLREVSMLMILYGSVNDDWVRQRLGAALQLSVIKSLPVKSFCVFSVPPEKKEEQLNFNLGPVQVHLIDNSKSSTLDPKVLAPVLQLV